MKEKYKSYATLISVLRKYNIPYSENEKYVKLDVLDKNDVKIAFRKNAVRVSMRQSLDEIYHTMDSDLFYFSDKLKIEVPGGVINPTPFVPTYQIDRFIRALYSIDAHAAENKKTGNSIPFQEDSTHSLEERKKTFINMLHMPNEFSVSYHKGSRVHLKYKGRGFALLDFWHDFYDFSTREEFMRAINVTNYRIVTYQKNNNAVIKQPYSDNSLVLRLISYILSSDNSIFSRTLKKKAIEESEQEERNVESDKDAHWKTNEWKDEITEKQIVDSLAEGKETEVVVKGRVNQELFRTKLDSKYQNKCCLCGITIRELLRASHIKPWCVSNPSEKTDVDNGLLLCANHDQLFDSGFISFKDNGYIMVSEELDMHTRILANLRPEMRIQVSEKMKEYLAYHRGSVFRRG